MQASKSCTKRSILASGVPRYHSYFNQSCLPSAIVEDKCAAPFSSPKAAAARRAPPPPPPLFAGKSFPAKFDEENPSAPISSVLLVQADEGVSHLVVDRIDVIYRNLP
ncbi:histone-lysine N-methyltransferase ASHR2 [Dorcoceras hygrometricum]|uniref:Histone-lysine N-methyltransferase ASHR2 n=1 Tax=Dorcoceras hygrometricum TaxID=472368 RepID=A0A2Z7D047_9LAMI|nr:histone-lysine N-methyltransferase ASHR2 [Dorcoceras hygrometricum]